MESFKEWDALFNELWHVELRRLCFLAVMEYENSSVTPATTATTRRVWQFVRRNPDRFGLLLSFVDANEFGIISVTKWISESFKALERKGYWRKVEDATRSNGMLFENAPMVKASEVMAK